MSFSQQDKQQTPSKRAWEGIRKTHSPPSWVKKDLETVAASPLELQTVEWEKTSATIPLVGQEIMDLQTEVWPTLPPHTDNFLLFQCPQTNKLTHHTHCPALYFYSKPGWSPMWELEGERGRGGERRIKISENQLNQLKREQEHDVSFYVVSFGVWTGFLSWK